MIWVTLENRALAAEWRTKAERVQGHWGPQRSRREGGVDEGEQRGASGQSCQENPEDWLTERRKQRRPSFQLWPSR